MTALPTPLFWLQTLGLLALQVAVLVALATAFERLLKSAPARRAVWQGVMLGLLVLALNAFTGADRALAQWAKSPPAHPRIAVARGNLPPTLGTAEDDFVSLPTPPSPASDSSAPAAGATWWPLWLWLVGAAAIGARALSSRLLLARFVRRGEMSCDPEIGERLAALSAGLGLQRPVRLVRSAALKGPIAFGWLRPTIGLPRRFFDSHPPAAQDTMLAHELAHLAARDPLWLALADALCALLWWHPAVWWLRRQFRAASETAADDASLLVQDGPAVLAECLVNLAAQLQHRRASGWLGMAEFRSGLGRRVERLLNLRAGSVAAHHPQVRWVPIGLVALVFLGLAGAAWAFPRSESEHSTLLAMIKAVVAGQLNRTAVEGPTAPSNSMPAAGSESHSKNTAMRPASQPVFIRFEEVGFDNLPLGDVLQVLSGLVKQRTQEGQGIDFLLSEEPPPSSTNSQPQAISSVRVTIKPSLRNVWMGEVLDAITKAADQPIKFTIMDHAVVFSARGLDATPRYARTFKLDWKRLTQAFADVRDANLTNPVSTSFEGLRRYLASAGWTPDPTNGDVMFMKPPNTVTHRQEGLLYVRATMRDLDLVESAIRLLKVAAEPDPGSAKSAPANPNTGKTPSALTETPVPQSPQAATNSEASGQLRSRTFTVDMPSLLEHLSTITGRPITNSTSVHSELRQLFPIAGWEPGQGEALFLDERKGTLFVRAAETNLALIEAVVETLSSPPLQLMVKAQFVEISQSDSRALGFDWFLGNVSGGSTNSGAAVTSGLRSTRPTGVFPGGGTVIATPRELRGNELDWAGRDATNAQNIRVSAALGANLTGILTDPQFRVVMKALEQRQGVDMLIAPSVTTLSGRQAQIRVQDLKTVVTGAPPAGSTTALATAVVPCGPMLDLVPTVLADGVTIQLKLKASVTEFLGYDPAPSGAATAPQPRFRERQLETTANVWDGQTLVLGGPIVEAAGSGTNATASTRKQLLVFVTPTLIDPAGNRLHTADEMPFSTNGVPPQPKPAK